MKHTITTVLILILSAIMALGQNNTLTIPPVTSSPGQTISLPINLDNTADVVALQFTLTMADGITLQPSKASLTERGEGLNVIMREMSKGKYMAMVFSSTNKAIIGRTGTLMTVPMVSSSSLDEGSVLPMTLSDVVIGITDGSNALTGFDAGSVTITKSPDLEVSDVTISATTVSPGEDISISWQVSNIGGQQTESGWSEQIYLESSTGESKVLSTVYYENNLNAGGIVARNATLTLPEILGLDGNAHIRVKLTPNRTSGEPSWLLDNNAAVSTSVISVGKKLSLTPEEVIIEEKNANIAKLYISRSGSTLNDLIVNLEATDDTRIKIPSTITIPKGQSGAYIYAIVTENGELDNNQIVEVHTICDDYTSVGTRIIIEDDTYPSLKITSEQDEVNEGETITLIIEAERVPVEDLEVKLTCDFLNRFIIPTVILPAGQNRAELIVEAKDDDTPDILQFVSFTASATGYLPDTYIVDLIDNDVPSLQLGLTPNAVSESAGPLSILAKLQRTDNIDKRVTIKFSDDSEGNIYYGNQTVEMAPGVKEITTSLGPIDNSIVDGERTYNISASVWIASCSCSATNGTSGGTVTVPVTIYDNDGPSLSLKSSVSTIHEGGNLEITVSRNNDTSAPLAVRISTDHDVNFDYPATVTIPAGEASATFTITSTGNDTTGDSFTTVFTVECEGYAKANLWFMVTDQTLPDGQVSAINVSKTEVEAGATVDVSVTIVNTGAYELPELTKVGFYIRSNNTPLATAYLQKPLSPGESVTMDKTITLPDAVGEYSLYAVVNDGQSIQELLYSNNMSENVTVKTVSPFTISLTTDKEVYMPGESISVSGKVVGHNISEKSIEIYVINDGFRRDLNTTTNESGEFNINFEPYEGQIGHFDIGACYPNEGLKKSMHSFEIYGIRHMASKAITCNILLGETYEDKLVISNPGNLPLSGLNINIVSKPDNCSIDTSCPEILDAATTVGIPFKITPNSVSDGNDWQKIVLSLESSQGVSLPVTLYYYCYAPTGKLQSSVSNIRTTMTKGTPRDYQFEITNIGKGSTGKISLALPAWMSYATPTEMAALEYGESATVVLRFISTENMQLNVPLIGQIGINCEHGDGLAIPFSVEPVSESTGVLTIDVCDEYTYYTADSPHLQGATVTIKHPTTGKLIKEGTTDENGQYSVQLNEGYYALTVSAQNHDSYSNTILVDPGVDKNVIVNLSVEGITVGWNVEETEIEDEYKVVTTVKYETNVPVPVVELSVPASIPAKDLLEGESLIFNAVLTNKGLITARDVEFISPTGFTYLKFEPLYYTEPFDLAPQQSVQIPVKVTHIISEKLRARPIDDDPCIGQPGTLYYWDCGNDRKWHRYGIAMQLGSCNSNDPSTWDNSGNGTYGGSYTSGTSGSSIGSPTTCPNIGGGSYIGSSSSSTNISSSQDEGCEPCQNKFATKFVLCGTGFVPYLGCATGLGSCAWDMTHGHYGWRNWTGCVTGAVGCVPGPIGMIANGIGCLVSLTEPCDLEGNISSRIKYKQVTSEPSYIREFQEKAEISLVELTAYRNYLLEYFGSEDWLMIENPHELENILWKLEDDENYYIDYSDYIEYRPTGITLLSLKQFIERLNNTTRYYDNGELSDNFIDAEKLNSFIADIKNAEEESFSMGFVSTCEMYQHAYNECKKRLEEGLSSVCASISLQFSQKMVLTRQAFKGTLTVFNGHETTAMSNVKLNLVVKDESGEIATSHEFQINPETLTGFNGNLNLGDCWTLDAQQTGVATIMFIPTKYAAPSSDKLYSFGGSLSYVDPFTGLEVTRGLAPITLTVKPSPNLDLTYFMQRDVIGDDPLTEAVEPCEEAEFSLLINNLGYGDAENVKITTEQPKIIDNEKGLLIDFELISSQLNGQDKTLALGESVTTNFGTIPAKTTSYAQWWIKSSLLGHFIDYNVEATHLTSYDNPDLSLLNEVTIHELIRSVEIGDGEQKLKGFMTNDIVDADDLPDMMYLSNGDIKPVSITASPVITKISDTDYSITVSPTDMGWNYGNTVDPTYGMVKLNRVRRQSDGKEISLRNFWQTDRTLRDGKDPLYENRIHFVDDFNNSESQTYILTFEPMPDILLEVESFDGIPADGAVASEYVEQVRVKFNKPIDVSTFTADDIMLSIQGKNQDTSMLNISTDDSQTFVIDFTEINKHIGNGYYILTIQTSSITDLEGFNGKVGKSVAWNMYINGTLLINALINPTDAGEVMGERNVQYGATANLLAKPNTGYDFSHWTVNGVMDSRDTQWQSIILGNTDVIANFVAQTHTITIDTAINGGEIRGLGTGIYNFGDEITLNAIADTDYEFQYWIVNGQPDTDSPTLKFSVDEDEEISALFRYIGLYKLQLNAAKGWNWISHNFTPALNIDNIANNENVVRILSQTTEAIRDPQYGIVGNLSELLPQESYKVETTINTSATLSGYTIFEPSTPIHINSGWNWLGYPVSQTMSVDEAFAPTEAENLDVIVGQNGFAQFDGEKWVGTLETLSPGLGYMYQSQSAKNVVYNTSIVSSAAAKYAAGISANSPLVLDIHKYPAIMPVVATIKNLDGFDLDNSDYQVNAFCGTECRGIGRVVNGLVMMNVYGNVGDKITFQVTKNDSDVQYTNNASLSFAENIVGNLDVPYAIAINGKSGIGDVTYGGNIKVSIVGDMLKIKGIQAENIELVEVYDIDGHRLIRETSVSDSGIKVSHLTTGVYVVIVNGDGEYTYHKIALR